MKHGDTVAVCYDGKWGRRTKGLILQGKKGTRILVEFQEYGEPDNIIQHWFRRKKQPCRYGGERYRFGGFVPVENSLMNSMFGAPGDWYSVWKWKD